MQLGSTYKIGTVEMLKVKRTGRRFYVNLDAEVVSCFGIEAGDVLRVRILEGVKPGEGGE